MCRKVGAKKSRATKILGAAMSPAPQRSPNALYDYNNEKHGYDVPFEELD